MVALLKHCLSFSDCTHDITKHLSYYIKHCTEQVVCDRIAIGHHHEPLMHIDSYCLQGSPYPSFNICFKIRMK